MSKIVELVAESILLKYDEAPDKMKRKLAFYHY